MTPTKFSEANILLTHPPDLDESQCMAIPAFVGNVAGGNLDGASMVVVAWLPSEDEKEQIALGSPIYLLCIGGLPPHSLSTQFPYA